MGPRRHPRSVTQGLSPKVCHRRENSARVWLPGTPAWYGHGNRAWLDKSRRLVCGSSKLYSTKSASAGHRQPFKEAAVVFHCVTTSRDGDCRIGYAVQWRQGSNINSSSNAQAGTSNGLEKQGIHSS
ncbi:hypothetical protein HYQ46_008338 [Verticillium longisporum]|nr:hypothetical protein HYQ46_008338 [Verticillium longisporum]